MSDELDKYSGEKEEFLRQFNALRPDLFLPQEWDGEKRNLALKELRSSTTKTAMFANIPMKCVKNCCYSRSCPLLAKGIAPFGGVCALEATFVQQFFADYVEELNIDLSLMVEVSMARDLVDQEIQYLRKTAVMAEDHFIQENVVGVDHEGKVITKKELHQAVDYEDRIHRRKERLRSALLATREARAKVGQVQLDTAQAISNIVESARKAELAKKKELDKALGTELRDEYIEAEIVTDDDAPDR